MPSELVAAARQQGRVGWLDSLPATVGHLRRRWAVEVGEPFQTGGQTAWVAPARRGDADLVLKVAWRHPEAEHEADGLRVWDGDGAVHLYDACDMDAETIALLIERCRPGTALSERQEAEQDPVVAGLLRRLWVPPPAGQPFRPLSEMCAMWADEFDDKVAAGRGVLDPGLARDGIELFRTLPGSAERSVLLCTDLHAGNVLAAEREPWLVVDPNPYVGDPAYDAVQHMINRETRLRVDPHGLARRMAGLLDLDADRLLLWLFARCVQESPDWPSLADVAPQVAPA
jgi:streptomycin 6-kinase